MQAYPPGTRIGQYEIASLPMMGGMGVVYFALDHGNDGRPVALKTFRSELLPDRAARDRFLREGTAWIELGSHPHIVRCYKVEYIDPTAFLVLELIAKEQSMPDASLRSWLIPGRPLPIDQALLFALQIARGMQYATEKIPGFVHRDLKPENILVGADTLAGTNINRLRVTDFGLVKTTENPDTSGMKDNRDNLKPSQVQFTRGAGTPLYMAPEQWMGKPVGPFTDIYAFGCILQEILTGQYAAYGNTLDELQEAHCDGRLRPLPISLPQKVTTLIKAFIQLKPANRPTQWSYILDALDEAYLMQSGQSAPHANASGLLSIDNELQIGWSSNAIGAAYLDLGNAEMALRYFDRAFAIGKGEDNIVLFSAAMNNLGLANTKLGNPARAIEYYERRLELSRNIGDKIGESKVLTNIGETYRSIGEIQAAIEFHERALHVATEFRDQAGEIVILSNLGNSYISLGEIDPAIRYLNQALEKIHKIGDRRGESAILNSIGEAYRMRGNPERSIAYHEQALQIAGAIGHIEIQLSALGSLGNTYAALGKLPQAIESYEQALEMSREIKDRGKEAQGLNNIGDAYRRLGNNQLAIENLQQSLVIVRELGYQPGEANAWASLGTLYASTNDLPQARNCYETALKIFSAIGDLYGKGSVSFNLAVLQAKQGYVAYAMLLARQAMQSFIQTGNTELVERVREFITVFNGSDDLVDQSTDDAIQMAFISFQNATTIQEMRQAVSQYPFMSEIAYIEAIEEIIADQESFQLKNDFEIKLALLRHIVDQNRI